MNSSNVSISHNILVYIRACEYESLKICLCAILHLTKIISMIVLYFSISFIICNPILYKNFLSVLAYDNTKVLIWTDQYCTIKLVICHILYLHVVLLLSFSADICQQPLNLGVGILFLPLDYYYYNSTNNTCSWFNYLGKGGNDNKFDNISSCQERCGMFYYVLWTHCTL